jgi:hypothetical protein
MAAEGRKELLTATALNADERGCELTNGTDTTTATAGAFVNSSRR